MYVALALALLSLALLPADVRAQSAEPQLWHGRIRCDALPGLTTLKLDQPFQLSVQAGQASYTRYVRVADTAIETSVPEHGGGHVAPDGTLTLQGGAEGSGYSYTSTYGGRLTPAGVVLTGTQHWQGPRFRPIDRPCTITLSR